MVDEKRISKGFWVWGQFDEASTEIITNFYEKVNGALNGPRFDVHLTLSGPILDLKNSQKSKLYKLTKLLSSVKLQAEDIGMKDHFFQSLFIKINNNSDLKNLKSQIDGELNLEDKKYFPHISLYYGNADKDSRISSVDGLRLPKEVVLDKISIVKVDEEIKSWKVLDSFSLLGIA